MCHVLLMMQENVSSSEDISAKTKSVIELKKLQLLDLQRRLRRQWIFLILLQIFSHTLFHFDTKFLLFCAVIF